LKILIAPDKFKGTLRAEQAAEIVRGVFRRAFPRAEILAIPLADGGEGTVSALVSAMRGELRTVQVCDPLGRAVAAPIGVCGKTFVLEMAVASGLALLGKCERDPMKTSTFGTGEMIRYALSSGASEIIMGIGGSATCDGGTGMAEALGAKFFDASNRELHDLCGGNLLEIDHVDMAGLDARLKNCPLFIASDVRNPLLGKYGAVAVFSPQKGATQETMPLLEDGLKHLADVLKTAPDCPGDGAAGGLGYGLRVFANGKFLSGARLVMEKSGFYPALEGADFVLTGEGCTDAQSEGGKVCCEVAVACRKRKIPCLLLSGCIGLSKEQLRQDFAEVFTSGDKRVTFEECAAHAEEDLACAAESVACWIAETHKESLP